MHCVAHIAYRDANFQHLHNRHDALTTFFAVVVVCSFLQYLQNKSRLSDVLLPLMQCLLPDFFTISAYIPFRIASDIIK